MSQLQLLNSSAAAAGASGGAQPMYVDDLFSTDVYIGNSATGAAQYVVVTNNINLSSAESGGSILMPGDASDQINVDAADSGNFNFGSGDFTIEVWLKTRQTGRADPFGCNYDYADTGWYGLIGNLNSSGDLAWYEGSNSRISASGTGWNDGHWHHIAITRSGSSVKLFLDGTQLGSTYTTSYSYGKSGGGFRFGDLWPGGTGQYMGFYSNCRVVKDTALYTSNFTAPTAPLTAVTNTRLLCFNSHDTISDTSGQNNTMNVYGKTYANGYGPFTIARDAPIGDTAGGLVIIKNRNSGYGHAWMDTEYYNLYPTFGRYLLSNSTDSGKGFNKIGGPFFNRGFVLGTSTDVSEDDNLFLASTAYSAHTFKKHPNFFDIVTYDGNGVQGRSISHNLGTEPGVIIIKSLLNSSTNWPTYAYGTGGNIFVNTDAVNLSDNRWVGDATDTTFRVGSGQGVTGVNESGQKYVAYLFALNGTGFGEDGTESVIKCGVYTGTGASGKEINLGWEPQFLMLKYTGNSTTNTGSGPWYVMDNVRGWNIAGSDNSTGFFAGTSWNTTNQETDYTDLVVPTSTGFRLTSGTDDFNTSNKDYIYIAVRHWKMRPPESTTKVFYNGVYTGTNTDNRLVTTNSCKPDFALIRRRDDPGAYGGMMAVDRYRDNNFYYTGAYTGVQLSDANTFMPAGSTGTTYGTTLSDRKGVGVGNDTTYEANSNTSSNNHSIFAFLQAKGFFDMVPYIGSGSARTISHNLGVVPELFWVRRMDAIDSSIYVYYGTNTKRLLLNQNEAEVTENVWNNTTPTASVFSLSTSAGVNASNGTYIAYLFASYPGISKVGTYTGNGTSQQINCGFTAGARFVLVKRVEATGNWVVFDTARGITVNDDPTFYLDQTTAELTPSTFNINPYSPGFEVSGNNNALNGSGSTYIYLAIA